MKIINHDAAHINVNLTTDIEKQWIKVVSDQSNAAFKILNAFKLYLPYVFICHSEKSITLYVT
jgi:cytochrome c1